MTEVAAQMPVSEWTISGTTLPAQEIPGYHLAEGIYDLVHSDNPGNSPIAVSFADLQQEGMRMTVDVQRRNDRGKGRDEVTFRAHRNKSDLRVGDVISDKYSLATWDDSFSYQRIDMSVLRSVEWYMGSGAVLSSVKALGLIGPGGMAMQDMSVQLKRKPGEKGLDTLVGQQSSTWSYDPKKLDNLVSGGTVLLTMPEISDALPELHSSMLRMKLAGELGSVSLRAINMWQQVLVERNSQRAVAVPA